MDQTLVEFIKTLRAAEIKASPADTIDAMHTLDLVGFKDKELLKNSLSLVLAKTAIEKERFYLCFDQFFSLKALEEKKSGANIQDGEDDSAKIAIEDSETADSTQAHLESELDEQRQDELAEATSTLAPIEESEVHSRLGKSLLFDPGKLTQQVIEAGRNANLNEIHLFTQKGRYAREILNELGMEELWKEILELAKDDDLRAWEIEQELRKSSELFQERVKDYVESQFLLYAKNSDKKIMEPVLEQIKLTNLEYHHYDRIYGLVQKMSKKLVTLYSRKKKTTRRGILDVKKTIRANAAYDGVLFDTKWKQTRIDRPKVFIICDVSGSVSAVARFLLMFLYGMTEVIPKLRSFAFSYHLGEVTELFKSASLEEAINKTLWEWGGGSTSYNTALADFSRICGEEIDKKSTIIILGDARNNYSELTNSHILKDLHQRSKKLLWLNPEPKSSWNTGDSIMKSYKPYCTSVHVCNSIRQLDRIVGNLMKYS